LPNGLAREARNRNESRRLRVPLRYQEGVYKKRTHGEWAMIAKKGGTAEV